MIANTNLDDGKGTKANMLINLDSNYQETLKTIYNIISEDKINFDQDPFFKAMKVPGMEPPPDLDRTTETDKN